MEVQTQRKRGKVKVVQAPFPPSLFASDVSEEKFCKSNYTITFMPSHSIQYHNNGPSMHGAFFIDKFIGQTQKYKWQVFVQYSIGTNCNKKADNHDVMTHYIQPTSYLLYLSMQ